MKKPDQILDRDALIAEAQATGAVALLLVEAILTVVCAAQSHPDAFLKHLHEHTDARIAPMLTEPRTAIAAKRMLELLRNVVAHSGRTFRKAQ